MAVMTSTLPRVLSVICLICLAQMARAESRPVPIRADAAVSPQPRRWFSFPRRPRANRAAEKPAHKPMSIVKDMVFAGLLGGGLGLWLLLRIIHFKMRAGHSVTANEEDAAMQTRETAALLGALFGCPAGLCIYDKLYPHSLDAARSLALSRERPPAPPQQCTDDRPCQGVGLE